MYIAIYDFKVKAGFEKQFEENWHIVTEAIYKYKGSLGSRLHIAEDGTYLAYAQWPSKEAYEKEVVFPIEIEDNRKLMREACVDISTYKLITVKDDLLKDSNLISP